MILKLQILFTILAAVCIAAIVPVGALCGWGIAAIVGVSAMLFFGLTLLCKQSQPPQESNGTPNDPADGDKTLPKAENPEEK